MIYEKGFGCFMKNVIVITGASSGMGKQFAVQISKLENVDEIWAIARDSALLEELKDSIELHVVPLTLDLTLGNDIEAYKNKLAEEKPNVKILVNSAGFGKFEHSEVTSTSVKQNMIDLNIKAIVSLIDYTLPYMNEGANIVNIASCAAFQPIPYINTYAATKAFVLSYSRALNRELKYRKIHVLAVCPFWTKTNFFNRAIDKSKKDVVIKYAAMYEPELVIKKAIKDMYNVKKDISVYGFMNNLQRFMVKIFPHSFVMNVWMRQQKLNGTPDIR